MEIRGAPQSAEQQMRERMKNVSCRRVLDEIWTYVQKKKSPPSEGEADEEIGEQYVFIRQTNSSFGN
jgi:hypothetical protein